MCFHRVKAPIQGELPRLTHTLSQRVARFLKRQGLLERDVENSDLVYEQQEEDVMQQLYGHKVKVIASIEDPTVIAPILKHLQQKVALKAAIQPHERPPEHAPPVMRRFD